MSKLINLTAHDNKQMAKGKLISIILAALVVAGGGYFIYNNQANRDVDSSDATTGGATENEENKGDTSRGPIADEEVSDGLTSDFPSDMPMYEGTITRSIQGSNSFGQSEFSATVETADSYEEVEQALRETFSNGGWKITNESDGLYGGQMLTVSNDKYLMTLMFDPIDDGVSIVYNFTDISS